MPRYYFDTIQNSLSFRDEEGLELADVEEARDEALKALGEIVRDSMPSGDKARFVISVRDGSPDPAITAVLSLSVERKQ